MSQQQYSTEGLNPNLVKKAQRGSKWGAKDQARYDKLKAERQSNVRAKKQARAEDFKNQKVQSAKDFNFNQHDKKSVEGTHVSGAEVRHLRQRHDGGEGSNVRDTYAALQAQKDAGATFGGRAQKQYDKLGAKIGKMDARAAAKEKAQAAQSPAPATTQPAVEPPPSNTAPEPVTNPTNPGNTNNGGNQAVGDDNTIVDGNDNQVGDGNTRVESGRDSNIGDASGSHTVGDNNSGTVGNRNAVVDNQIDNSQKQTVEQDNDINSNVNGDNNYVYNNQDNSIRNYGGDNRSFVYNSSGGDGTVDTPGTMATLAGFYAPDDSPAAVAGRLDMQQDLNAQAQKKYANTSHIAQGAISRASQNMYIDPAAIDERVRGREQNSYDRAALMSKNLWGDLSNMNFNWNSNKPADPVEQPDFKKMKDDYTDF